MAWARGVEALRAAESRRAELRLPKERIESRRNQVPFVETADLRATTINFFRWKILYFRLIVLIVCFT